MEIAQQVFEDFEARLHQWGASIGAKVDWPTWMGPKKMTISRNIFLLSDTTDLLLHVKIRSRRPGFWGLSPNRLSLLRVSGREWWVVLLVESPETGYLLPSKEVDDCTNSGVWALARNKQYKVNQSRVSEEFYFSSFGELTKKLASRVKTQPFRHKPPSER